MRPARKFYVYIMTNNQRSHVLYVGITGDLIRRAWEHKNKLTPGFTSRYNLSRLVYHECFFYPDAAIGREKEIKGWRRNKKIELIESMNSHWRDLAAEWQNVYKPEVSGAAREIPRPAGENAGLRDDAEKRY
jgi:putative endonuclease